MVEILNGARMIPPISRVGVSHQVHKDIFPHLESAGWDSQVIEAPSGTDALITMIRDKGLQALIGRTDINLLDPTVLKECPDLSLFLAACRDPRLNIEALRKHGVWALRANSNTQNVARCVMNLLEGLGLGTVNSIRSTDIKDFDKVAIERDTFDLEGKHLGIVGLGEIGFNLAKLAINQGMHVSFVNDGDGERNYDLRTLNPRIKELQELAQHRGVTFERKASIHELATEVDILSLHTNGEDSKGKTNSGLISDTVLDALNHKNGLRILVNFARRPLLPQDDQTLLKRIDDDKLSYYVTDVYDPELEKKGAFRHPAGKHSKFPAEVRRRFIGTSHIGGSGPNVGANTAKYIGENLIPQWEGGYFDMGSSTLYLRHSLDRDGRREGDVVATLVRTTKKGVLKRLGDAIDDLGFSLSSSGQSVADLRSGTDNNHLWVPSTFVLTRNGRSGDYADDVQALAHGISKLNNEDAESIVNMRFIPTSDKQKAVLSDPNFRYAHNLGEI